MPASEAASVRRREILTAASRLFRERGLQRVGMREIAHELGCTAGNLYYYFPSKTDLLTYCQEATLDELLAVAEQIAGDDDTATIRLGRLIRAHIVCLNETYPGSLAHLEVETLEPDRRAELLAKRHRYQRLIEEMIAEGIRRGELEVPSPRLAALALLGAVNWTVKWFSVDGELEAGTVGEVFSGMLLDGLRRREA